jgi:hypothetical protein
MPFPRSAPLVPVDPPHASDVAAPRGGSSTCPAEGF